MRTMRNLGAVALAAAMLASGILGWRVVVLEQRVAVLSKQLGAPQTGARAQAAEAAGAGNHEQRLRALEQQQRALREDLQTLEEATGEVASVGTPSPNDPKADQRILSVVGAEQNRIRDRQLEFHRARWLEWRKGALNNFARDTKLSTWQTEQLQQLLADEVDALIDIWRRPEAMENPEQAAGEWLDRLKVTDAAAHRILEPAQIAPWDLARVIERKVFWPWLPER